MGYIRALRDKAACSLIDELDRLGISAAVGYTTARSDGDGRMAKVREKVLQVEPHSPLNPEQQSLVPDEWMGFRVVVNDTAAKLRGEE